MYTKLFKVTGLTNIILILIKVYFNSNQEIVFYMSLKNHKTLKSK